MKRKSKRKNEKKISNYLYSRITSCKTKVKQVFGKVYEKLQSAEARIKQALSEAKAEQEFNKAIRKFSKERKDKKQPTLFKAKAEEIFGSIRDELILAKSEIKEALDNAKATRAFNKAARKAGKARRAQEKQLLNESKEKQTVINVEAEQEPIKDKKEQASGNAEMKEKPIKVKKKQASGNAETEQETIGVKERRILNNSRSEPKSVKTKTKKSTDTTKQKKSTAKKKKKKIPLYRRVLSLVIKIMIFGLCLIIVFGYIFGLSRNQSLNMQPSFQDGDLIFYLRMYNNYKANDTVLIVYQDKTMLERVVAVGGDTVDITEDGLVVNGGLVQESYAWGETTQFENGVTFPLTVPEGKIFVLGDNREHATDSRILGCIDEDDVSGSVIGAFRRRNF